MTGPQARPISILIAALGGEGGGVLTDWIVAAASQLGFPVQSTSIPGVAQRTGATTYYIELVPVPWRDLGANRPVLALAPGSPTSTSCWRASSWRRGAPSPRASSRPIAR